jgi:hypothetical protein
VGSFLESCPFILLQLRPELVVVRQDLGGFAVCQAYTSLELATKPDRKSKRRCSNGKTKRASVPARFVISRCTENPRPHSMLAYYWKDSTYSDIFSSYSSTCTRLARLTNNRELEDVLSKSRHETQRRVTLVPFPCKSSSLPPIPLVFCD